MHIYFALPGSAHYPVGGFKVAFEYANKLTEYGHTVSILLISDAVNINRTSPKGKIYRFIYFYYRKIFNRYMPNNWFKADHSIKFIWLSSSKLSELHDIDTIIATSWQTALIVNNLQINDNSKYYLLQHLETWSGDYQQVIDTWRLPLKKIVISQWLKEIANGLGQKSVYIPNGLDFKSFNLDRPIESRNKNSIMMLYHREEWKGSQDGLNALAIVKKRFPDIRVNLYGVFPQPKLPPWIEYYHNPSQLELRNLYNTSSIFVSPSWSEGFPLPPCEAMMCGAALVATDIGGHHEMAINNETALLCPPHSPELLAENIIKLLDDDNLRHTLAKSAYHYIQKFTWDKAAQKLLAYITLR